MLIHPRLLSALSLTVLSVPWLGFAFEPFPEAPQLEVIESSCLGELGLPEGAEFPPVRNSHSLSPQPVLLPQNPDRTENSWKDIAGHFRARVFEANPSHPPSEALIESSEVGNEKGPEEEKREIHRLVKLGKLGSGVVLQSNNNQFSVEAWKVIAKQFQVRKLPYRVDWAGSAIHIWDQTNRGWVKKLEPMHSGHFEDLLKAGLQMTIYEPVLSNLKIAPRKKGDAPVAAAGLEWSYAEPEREQEKLHTELGAVWAELVREASLNGNPLTLKISSDRFSEEDMLEILRKGGRIELNIAGARRFDFQTLEGCGLQLGYEKIQAFLQKAKSHQLQSRLTVRYNGKSLEQLLKAGKEVGPPQTWLDRR